MTGTDFDNSKVNVVKTVFRVLRVVGPIPVQPEICSVYVVLVWRYFSTQLFYWFLVYRNMIVWMRIVLPGRRSCHDMHGHRMSGRVWLWLYRKFQYLLDDEEAFLLGVLHDCILVNDNIEHCSTKRLCSSGMEYVFKSTLVTAQTSSIMDTMSSLVASECRIFFSEWNCLT